MQTETQVAPEFVVASDPFDCLVSLSHEVTFFVPSTRDGDVVDPELQQMVLAYVNEFLSTAYGGTTEWASCEGHWLSGVKGMISEKVTPITCYIPELTTEIKSQIVWLARYILDTMRQEAVLIVIDGKGALLPNPKGVSM